MSYSKWYGLNHDNKIVYLGEHHDFDGASDVADKQGATVWIFDRPTLVSLAHSILDALE
jgi:hypothetical protein